MNIISIIVDSLIISILLYGGIFLMIKINPRSQLHNYPPSIRNTVEPKNKKEIMVFLIIGLPMFILIIAYIIISFIFWFKGSGITYLETLIRWTIVHAIASIFDLFICDYLIFCTLTPKFIIIPGTENNPGYKDKSYHTKTIPTMIILCIILGALCSLTYFLV